MRSRLRFAIGAGLVASAVAYLIVTAIRNTAEYYLTVNEVKARQAELAGQMLRVAGRVEPGTISWDAAKLKLVFSIVPPPPPGQGGVEPALGADPPSLRVICEGQPKPDMFAPNRDVIVDGRLAGGNTIVASQVLTSCPSKYIPKKPG